jgi:diguanylate cyclase (GGDEF)-like protein/PAS domain S-box-containing protein
MNLPLQPGSAPASAPAGAAGGDALVNALFAMLERAGCGLTLKDAASGRYERVNATAAAILGLPAEQLIGHQDSELFIANQAVALRAADQQALALGDSVQAEHRIERPDGSRLDCLAVRLPVAAAAGQPARWVATLWQDISEPRKREAQLQAALSQLEAQERANDALRREMQDHHVRDQTTGLYQRAHFEEHLRREADLSAREHREFALVCIGVDGLDALTAEHGDTARERLLETLGRLLRANTRVMDSPCRLGPDRFVILLSGVGLATAHSRMEGLRRQCAEHIVAYSGRQLNFTVSMGVASYPHTAGAVEQLLKSAETALSMARERGGNRVVLASIQFDAAAD